MHEKTDMRIYPANAPAKLHSSPKIITRTKSQVPDNNTGTRRHTTYWSFLSTIAAKEHMRLGHWYLSSPGFSAATHRLKVRNPLPCHSARLRAQQALFLEHKTRSYKQPAADGKNNPNDLVVEARSEIVSDDGDVKVRSEWPTLRFFETESEAAATDDDEAAAVEEEVIDAVEDVEDMVVRMEEDLELSGSLSYCLIWCTAAHPAPYASTAA